MSLEDFLKEAREKSKVRRLAETWKPQNEGEELYGIVEDVFPNPWDSNVITCVVKTPEGKRYMLPRNKVLVSSLVEDPPNPGDLIYVRYEGEGRKKGGFKAPKLFAVYVKHVTESVEIPTPTATVKAEETQKMEEEMPKVETAREIEVSEEREETGYNVEKIKEALQHIVKEYGVYLTNVAFEKALKNMSIEMTVDELKKLLPDVVKTTKWGVMIKL
ncbi:MAG: hypothetical protein QW599_05580 [Nitrososphaerota archaeon]